jgi:L,D-transpeptidase catalytic domain
MTPSIFLIRCAASALMLFPIAFLQSCGTSDSRQPVRTERVLYQWHDDGGPGRIAMTISLTDQIADFERGGRHVGWCFVATGKEGHGTPAGSYKITEKIEDKYSNKYGWIEDEFGTVVDNDAKVGDRVPEGCTYVPAPMPYWMRLTSSGIGMHGGLIPEPGKPASHGCIRLPKQFVPLLYDAVEIGTPVAITRSKRKYFQDVPAEMQEYRSAAQPKRTQAPAPGAGYPNSYPYNPNDLRLRGSVITY